MSAEKLPDGSIRIEFDIDKSDKLAAAIIKDAEDMPSVLLELSSLLREAKYSARNAFRQPPHAFDERAPRFPSM